ncbi:cytochrome P450 [Variovorax sp. J31P207]|uniref:cytochrome P450 n=1 Tax=Variovorax sp. J31P207 TaxID=3053510 RepID=UPI002578F345|nr:cytochrome P450 [Variovorax sp. J31P207]MDM0066831.1 cytochrome P450 [Variovorax sp. J31P207]
MNIAELDQALASHELFSNIENMHATFQWVRRNDPLHWTDAPDHPPFWAVTKHADVIEVGKHPDVFVAEPKTFLLNDEESRIRAEETAATGGKMVRTMIHMDGTDHRKYRGLTQAWFMPASIKRLDAVIRERASDLVTQMLERDGRCDFYNDIAVWYPLRIIMGLLNVPESDHAYLLHLTQQFLAPKDETLRREGSEGQGKGAVAKEYFAYFGKLLADRRSRPQTEDLDSSIAHAQVDGQPLGLMEAVSYYVILATAGHDTTSSSMGSGLYYLLRNPAEQERLRAGPELMPTAVEEMFRFASPVKHFVRTATQDFELRGKTIRAGQELALMYHSANFDEEVFEDPLRFKLDRSPNRQIAFGYGVHACLGQNLARASMRAFFSELLARTEWLELDGEPNFISTNQVGGLKTLPVRYASARMAA